MTPRRHSAVIGGREKTVKGALRQACSTLAKVLRHFLAVKP